MFNAGLLFIASLTLGLSSFFTLPFVAIFLSFTALAFFAYLAYIKLTPQEEWLTATETIADTTAFTTDLPAEPINWNRLVKKPKVWIVDDDEDLALVMQASLKKMGIHANVITNASNLHRKIISDRADYILLDWMLNSNLTADMVMKKAIRLINSASYFKDDFANDPAHVVTYSSLAEDEINVPKSVFFEHMGHLEKSTPRHEVLKKFSELVYNSELQKQSSAAETMV